MDRDEAIRRAEVAMAWARGETVQWRAIDGHWRDCDPVESDVIPGFYDDDWRIKPKPLEVWVWVPNHKTSPLRVCGGWAKESELPIEPDYIAGGGRWVRMREIDE